MFNYFSDLDNLPVLIIITVWSLIWKGLALWRSARLQQKVWFVIILILNTVGILEIIYLLLTQKKVKGNKPSQSSIPTSPIESK